MSSTTPYLGLILYDSTTDQAVAFATFRAVWGGPATSSNFYKIDTGLFDLDARIDILESYRGAIPVAANYISANYYEASGVTGVTSYTSGMAIVLSLDTTSSGTVTLNINALGTKSLMKIDSTGAAINLTGSDLVKNRRALFVYDGTRWLWVSANSADQISIVGTAGNVVTVNTDNTLLGTLTQSLLISQTINSATDKDTPVDADKLGLVDSAASNVLKALSWLKLKATLWGFTTTATAAGTTTLTSSSTPIQEFTGSTTQTVTLPVVSTLYVGYKFKIINSSTGIVTVNSSGSNLIKAVQPSTTLNLTCVLITGTTAASWKFDIEDPAGAINNAVAKTTPVDADRFGFLDSVSGLLNHVTWANIKATLVATYALIVNGGANLKMFMNAAGTAAEWAKGLKIGTFTYDTATASGTQAITGVGFKPSVVFFIPNVNSSAEISFGFSDGTSNYCVYNTHTATAYTWSVSATLLIVMLQTGSINSIATLTTLDSDGFTLTWVKTGAKTGTATVLYMALR